MFDIDAPLDESHPELGPASERAARYAGIPIKRTVIAVLLISGGLAGLAGAGEVGGTAYALDPNRSEEHTSELQSH